MLYILNEKYLVPKYIPNSENNNNNNTSDCNSLWLHGKKYPGYLVHNVTAYDIISGPNRVDDFLAKLITELLIVFTGPNKEYLTGYKYNVTKDKIYSDKKNCPKLELLIGEGVDESSPLATNIDYLKKINFSYYSIIEYTGSAIIINWELLLYLLKKINYSSMLLSKLIDTLYIFKCYHSLTDKGVSTASLCISYQMLFKCVPNILYRLIPSQLRKKCIKQIKRNIRTELQNILQFR
jgi:hypothetical protein